MFQFGDMFSSNEVELQLSTLLFEMSRVLVWYVHYKNQLNNAAAGVPARILGLTFNILDSNVYVTSITVLLSQITGENTPFC